MIISRITFKTPFLKSWSNKIAQSFRRNVQVSVIGAASDTGSNLALLLKQNNSIKQLKLYDDDERVRGVGMELAQLPGGPQLSVFAGPGELGQAIQSSDIIAMVARTPRKPGNQREQMMDANALLVGTLARAMVAHNPEAFLALSTNPINSIVPFVSTLLKRYKIYNPFKVLGITNIDTARSRAIAGSILKVNSNTLHVPVIGGHSDQTIIPLFSNLSPSCHAVDMVQADTLTRLVRRAGTEIVMNKKGTESATISMAWAINEFLEGLVNAVTGKEVFVNCYAVNPYFGTKYFSGPTKIGRYGIIETCYNLPMTEYESYLLNCAVPMLNKDVALGENYVNYIESRWQY